MDEIKKIMAAVCFSEYCRGTLDCAARLATLTGAKLIIANVINVRDVESVSQIQNMGFQVNSADYISGLEEQRAEWLDEMIVATGFPKKQVKAVFRVGHPFEELMKTIEEEGVDMVVMGVKGRTNLENVLMGSVAQRVFRHCPVTVVSHRQKSEIRGRRSDI